MRDDVFSFSFILLLIFCSVWIAVMAVTVCFTDEKVDKANQRLEGIAVDVKAVRAWIDAGGSNMSYEADVTPGYEPDNLNVYPMHIPECTTQGAGVIWITEGTSRTTDFSKIQEATDSLGKHKEAVEK